MSDRRPTMQDEADAQLKWVRENMREVPDRVTATFNNWRNPNAGACYKSDAGDTEYIRRDPAVLAALPEVQTLIDAAVKAERERCAKVAETCPFSTPWVAAAIRKEEQP